MENTNLLLKTLSDKKLLHQEDNIEQEQYFFSIKSETKEELLRSRPYPTPEERQEGIEIALQQAQDGTNFEVKEAGGDYYFVLKDAENNSIARSDLFDSQTKVKRTIKQVEDLLTQAKPESASAAKSTPKKTTAKKKTAPRKKTKQKGTPKKKTNTKSEATMTTSPMDDTRFVFRLTFYKSEDTEALQGQIEYMGNNEKQNFDGIDEITIGKFLKSQLATENLDTSIAASTQSTQLKLKANGVVLTGNQMDRTARILLEIDTSSFKMKRGSYQARVIAKSLRSESEQLIGEQQKKLEGNVNISLPIFTASLAPGLFRIKATVRLVKDHGETTTVAGEKLVHVY